MDGSAAPDWAVAVPCGLSAKYVFNDKFELSKKNKDGSKTLIPINSNDIAWGSDDKD